MPKTVPFRKPPQVISACPDLENTLNTRIAAGELAKETLLRIEALAQDILDDAGLTDISLTLTDDAVRMIGVNPYIYQKPMAESYAFTGDTGGTSYYMGLRLETAQTDAETTETSYYVSLLSIEEGSVKRYLFDTGTWEESPMLNDLAEILKEPGAKTRFIITYASHLHWDPLCMNPSMLLELLEANAPLIDLYDKMGSIAAYDFLPLPNGSLRTILVPADSDRFGAAVYYNGTYRACMLMADEASGYLLEEVFSESSAERMSGLLYQWWDHYTPAPCFTIPLSEDALIQIPEPYTELRMWTIGEERDLTDEENKRLGHVIDLFEKRKKQAAE